MPVPKPDPTPDLLTALQRLVNAIDPEIGRDDCDLEEFFKEPTDE
jgi:hypothetical protein